MHDIFDVHIGDKRIIVSYLPQQYEELDKAGSFMRLQSMKPKARTMKSVGEDDEGSAEMSPKPFGNSPRLYGSGAQV